MTAPKRTGDGRWLLPASVCPECDAPLDGAGNRPGEDEAPEPDDLTLCMACGAILQFDADLCLVPSTADNLAQARRDMPDAVRDLERVSGAVLARIAKEGR